MVTLIGLGGGTACGMTAEAAQALEEAEVLIGAQRMLAAASESRAEKFAEYRAEEILAIIREHMEKEIAVLFSGDTGFYSGASKLIGLLEREEIAFRVLPGLSSVQLLAARIGKPWQDWNLVSAHGTECDPVAEVRKGKDVFFLTGGKETPGSICRELAEAGYGELRAVVGEELGYPEERVRRGNVRELAGEEFKGLSVLLVSRVKYANSVGKDTREGSGGTVTAVLGTVPEALGEALNSKEKVPGSINSVGKDTREGSGGTVPASLGTVPVAKGEASASGRILISAMGSGSGKTVVTCGLLTALRTRGVGCEAMKCGPDYIDPMFHAKVLGVPSRNLDLFLQGHDGVRRTLESRRESISVIEGAMGLFDGVGGTIEASAWEIAASCGIPVILAVKPGGSSATLAAQIRGLMTFREPNQIAGVILTACRESLYERLKPVIERETGLSVFGYLPPMKEAEIPSRHLGLMTADEVADLRERFLAVAAQMEKTVDIAGIIALAGTAETKPEETAALEAVCRIAVARDEAFSFYYEDSFRALREAGAEITFFSPVRDESLPECDGLYLGGGYPELYAAELERNASMRESIRTAVLGGLPTVAECGGFLYLQESLEDADGVPHAMAGALPGRGFKTGRLQRFGYAYLAADEDSLLFRKGEKVPVHEFHYWDSTENGTDLHAAKPDGRTWECGYASPTIYAGFPHLHFGGEAPLAERFVEAARKERKR